MRLLAALVLLAAPLAAQGPDSVRTDSAAVWSRQTRHYFTKHDTVRVKDTVRITDTLWRSAESTACVGDDTTFALGDSLQLKVNAQPTGTAFRLCAGIHRMQSVVPKNGMSFIGDSGAVMTGARVLTGPWTLSGSNHYVGGQTQQGTVALNAQCQTIDPHPGCALAEQLWVNNHLYERVVTLGTIGVGKWYFDTTANRIYLPFNPTDSTVETSVTQWAFGGSATGVTVRRLTIQRYAGARPGVVVNNSNAASWTIDTNVVRDNNGVSVACSTGGIIRGNTVVKAGQMGYKAQGTGCLIYGNVFDSNNTAGHGMGGAGEAGAGKAANTTGLVFRKNISRWNDGPGIWVDINNLNSTIDSNTVDDNAWRGIFCEISYGCVIKYNTARRNGYAIPSATIGACDGAGILVSSSSDVEVAFNVVEDNRNGICAQETDRPAGPLGEHHLVNLFVHDNVVKQLDDGRAAGSTDQDPAANPYSVAANNRWQKNEYHRLLGTTRWRWSPNVDVTEAAWRAVQDSASTFGP